MYPLPYECSVLVEYGVLTGAARVEDECIVAVRQR